MVFLTEHLITSRTYIQHDDDDDNDHNNRLRQ